MYDRDAKAIAGYAWASSDGLLDIIAFTLLTIRQPFHKMKQQMADVAVHGADSIYLFGFKRNGYVFAHENKSILFANLKVAKLNNDREMAVHILTQVPGLGIVKASFVAQMLGFNTACLDTHNLSRLGITDKAFRLTGKETYEKKFAKIRLYQTLCDAEGDTAYWWNTWCDFVAGRRGSHLTTADEVSFYHWDAITECL